MEINISGIDSKKGLELFEGDIDTYLDILQSYVTNIPAVLDLIRNVSAETLQDYSARVHGIKSASDSIGAEEARKTAKYLEDISKSGDLAGVLAKNEAFVKYIEDLVANIRIWLEKNNIA